MGNEEDQGGSLWQRLEQGDQEALAELFSQHRERLWRMVHFRLDRRLHGRVDADDVLQEAYLDALQRLPHYLQQRNMSFFVWLRCIVGQTLVDIHRKHLGAQMRAADREIPIHNALSNTTSVSLAAQLLGHLTSPSQAAMRHELARQLEEALEKMNPIDREVLALRHFEELTNSEVAEVLGIQQKAASIRYVRAVKRLKQILSEVPGMEGEVG
ncbi:MAG: sigma-70 family RNA polymerase sigma factor [Planctomycetes bacterium]|nr:sigma-70 family RNA polymerase sigma factor [Planctomycetota bacterium]